MKHKNPQTKTRIGGDSPQSTELGCGGGISPTHPVSRCQPNYLRLKMVNLCACPLGVYNVQGSTEVDIKKQHYKNRRDDEDIKEKHTNSQKGAIAHEKFLR